MNREFIPYKLALELKELGFDEYCFAWYDSEDQEILNYDNTRNSCEWLNGNACTAPTYSQAFRFFREKFGYNCFIPTALKDGKWYYFRENLNDRTNDSEPEFTPKFDTYEEAEKECLIKLIEIVKEGKNENI
jgi:hypothetical protein